MGVIEVVTETVVELCRWKYSQKRREARGWDVGGCVHGVESAHHVGRTGHGERDGEGRH